MNCILLYKKPLYVEGLISELIQMLMLTNRHLEFLHLLIGERFAIA